MSAHPVRSHICSLATFLPIYEIPQCIYKQRSKLSHYLEMLRKNITLLQRHSSKRFMDAQVSEGIDHANNYKQADIKGLGNSEWKEAGLGEMNLY